MTRRTPTLLIAAALVGGLGFTAQVAENSTLGVASIGSTIEPAFRVSRFRNEIHLAGHTISAEQERALLAAAAQTYPGFAVHSEFEPLGLVPSHWEASTMQVMAALAGTTSGTAIIDPTQVTFNVVTLDDDAWHTQLGELRSSLAATVDIEHDAIPVAARQMSTLCAGAFRDFAPGSIHFEESTTVFRPSAYPQLEQVAALADACRDADIRITGHSDASGNEEWNVALSHQRADAVASYLMSRGIAEERMQIVSAGSSQPIASNESRYGRGLNRRIDVAFATR